ncbi:MAG: FtsX-like permease family protein, partial [Planctomycetales bacterium]
GLLLGMFGLAAVQLRNVFARRGELAVMRVTGFRRSRLAEMVLLENVVLLCCGLGIGIGAALLAVIPHFFISSATVPWQSLTVTLGLVLFLGLAAGLGAVQATVKAPLIATLRGE